MALHIHRKEKKCILARNANHMIFLSQCLTWATNTVYICGAFCPKHSFATEKFPISHIEDKHIQHRTKQTISDEHSSLEHCIRMCANGNDGIVESLIQKSSYSWQECESWEFRGCSYQTRESSIRKCSVATTILSGPIFSKDASVKRFLFIRTHLVLFLTYHACGKNISKSIFIHFISISSSS